MGNSEFAGRTYIVTGGGSGIGLGAAKLLGEAGANVVIADVSAEAGSEAVRLVEEAGGHGLYVETDVADPDQVENLVATTVSTFGGLNGAVNNAGIEGPMAAAAEYEVADWNRVLGINLHGVFLCMKYQIPHLLEGGGGAIVNTASVAGVRGGPTMAAYVASKHGVIGLTRAAAIDYATSNIRINAIAPGSIHTAMVDRLMTDIPEDTPQQIVDTLIGIEPTPMKRLGTPEETGKAIMWLLSEDSSFVTGSVLAVDGGWAAG